MLQPIYQGNVFKAGKNIDKVRFNFKECLDFKMLNNQEKRTLVIYLKTKIESEYQKKLNFFIDLYQNQKIC